MCGITGVFNNDSCHNLLINDDLTVVPSAQGAQAINPLRTMLDRIEHRGPDGEGVFASSTNLATLAHCRLAIMDPVGGAQPLYSEDRETVLVSNGEIYNYQTLRNGLTEQHDFYTQTDNETILHLIEEADTDAIQQLDGMFAFALYQNDRFVLARDPIGIKPLYVGVPKETAEDVVQEDVVQIDRDRPIYFASELKAFADTDLHVREFPPGTYFDSEKGWVNYYTVPEQMPVPQDVEEIIKTLRSHLETAVVKRMMSDVPLGAFLSGGLDSSLIAAIARQQVDELHTFSVGIEGANDIEAARLVAKHIGSVHHEYLYSAEEVVAHLPEIVYHLESFDQDLVRSAIPCYFCSRLAAEHVKVILTGEGADELFAGYTYYKAYTDPAQLHHELRRSISALHNINLQRVDRLTMAHGIEGRVPFLDMDLIAYAQTIDPLLKLKPASNGRQVEKWILRKACEDLLPDSIVWRDKEQFDEGSGTVDLLGPLIAEATAKLDVPTYTATHAADRLRSSEECYYHQLLSQAFPNPRLILDNVARWSMN